MSHSYPGTLISFEGLDGAGKSTQIERTAADLRAQGKEVLILREPGGTKVGELVRAIVKADTQTLIDSVSETAVLSQPGLVNRILKADAERRARDADAHGSSMTHEQATEQATLQLRDQLSDLLPAGVLPDDATPRAQMFLFNAARAQLFETVIIPALQRGAIVVCDRLADSTVAYQAGGGGMPEHEVVNNCLQATGGLEPDLTIYCRLEPEVRLQRMAARGIEEDAIERSGAEYFERVAAMFDKLAKDNTHRFVVVDASQSINDVAAQIRPYIQTLVIDDPMDLNNVEPLYEIDYSNIKPTM